MIIFIKAGPEDTYPLHKINNNTLIIISPESHKIRDLAIIRGLIVVEEEKKEKNEKNDNESLKIDLIIDLINEYTIKDDDEGEDDDDKNNNSENLEIPTIFTKLNIIKFKCEKCNIMCENKFDIQKKSLFNMPLTYCSEKCIEFSSPSKDITKSPMYIPKNSEIFNEIELNDSNNLINNFSLAAPEKFQDSMRKEAVRLEYAIKRETYKKEMKQISLKKSLSINNSNSNSNRKSLDIITCKSKTKKGKKCTNKVVNGGEYCGIASHFELGQKNEVSKDLKDLKDLNFKN